MSPSFIIIFLIWPSTHVSVSQSTTELRFFFLYYVNKNRGYAEQKKRFGTALWRVRYRATEFGVLGSKKNLLLFGWGKKLIVSVGCIDANNWRQVLSVFLNEENLTRISKVKGGIPLFRFI